MGNNAMCAPVSWSDYDWHDITCNLHSNGPSIAWNPAVYCIFASSFAITIVMALHIILKNIRQFKKRKTVYFWSILVVSLGLLTETLAYILHIFIISIENAAYDAINAIGMVAVITGFAMVLYSRLHLITQKKRFLNGLLIMITIVSIIGHAPAIADMVILSTGNLTLGMKVADITYYVQLIFPIQECFLSGAYMFFFWGYVNDVPDRVKTKIQPAVKATFCLLVAAFGWILMSNVLIYVLNFEQLYLARDLCFNLVFGIKIEIEFYVLNRLVRVSQLKRDALSNPSFTVSVPQTQLLEAPKPTSTAFTMSGILESQTGPKVDKEISPAPPIHAG